MKTTTEDEFLRWASTKGLGLNPKYPQSAVLDFQGEYDSRFWEVPPEPECRPYFLALLLDLMGDWQTCYVWRHLGSWPDPKHIDPDRVANAVEMLILKGLGLPLGTRAVVQFDRSEREALVALLLSTTIFGWSVVDDLYVVPDHARQIIQTDHHGVVHVSFADAAEVERWVSKMAEDEFYLPAELPDATFKRPAWMGKLDQRPFRRGPLQSVLAAGRFILEWTEGVNEHRLWEDKQKRAAVERQFEVIAEALRRLRESDPATCDQINDAGTAIGLGEAIQRDHDRINYGILWRATRNELPAMLQQVEALLADST